MLQIYKPNPKVTGSCCSFKYNGYNDTFFIEMLKQTGWDDQKKRGSFKGSQTKIVSKFNINEVAAMIDVLNRNVEWKIFHSSPKGTTSGTFRPYLRNDQQVGYSLALFQKNSDTGEQKNIVIGLNYAESELLKEFLRTCIHQYSIKAIKEQEKYAQKKWQEQQNEKVPQENHGAPKEDWNDWSNVSNNSKQGSQQSPQQNNQNNQNNNSPDDDNWDF